MKIKRHLRCNGAVDGNTLTQPGRNMSASVSKNGSIEWYICGAGAKAEGFRPQQWIAKVNGLWYIRLPGNNGQRGQYRKTKDGWSTQVVAATPEQAIILEKATVVQNDYFAEVQGY